MLCYAHRGGALEGPENTMPAFAQAVQRGAHGLELEVRATADRRLVVFHDRDVQRVTDGRGNVDQLNLKEIGALEVTAGPADFPRDRPVRIPLLEEVLEAFPSTYVNIDIKETEPDVEPYEDLVANAIRAHGRSDDVIVASFHARALDRFRSLAPRIASSLDPDEVAALWQGEALPDAHGRRVAAQVPVTWQGVEVVTDDFIRRAHEQDLAVHVWTVDEPAEMRRLIAMGVDGIVTDRPSALLEVLAGT